MQRARLSERVPPARVLVVDDQPIVLGALRGLLEFDGYDVDTAENGAVALVLLARHAYDIVLCDLLMPEMDGVELYHRVERYQPHVCQNFIFITGQAASDYEPFLTSTAAPCVRKPITLLKLQEAIEALLRPAAASTTRAEAIRLSGRADGPEGDGTRCLSTSSANDAKARTTEATPCRARPAPGFVEEREAAIAVRLQRSTSLAQMRHRGAAVPTQDSGPTRS